MKHDFKAAREQLQQQLDQMDDDFDWSGFTVMFDGKHAHSIVTALRLAEKLMEEPMEEPVSNATQEGMPS